MQSLQLRRTALQLRTIRAQQRGEEVEGGGGPMGDSGPTVELVSAATATACALPFKQVGRSVDEFGRLQSRM